MTPRRILNVDIFRRGIGGGGDDDTKPNEFMTLPLQYYIKGSKIKNWFGAFVFFSLYLSCPSCSLAV